MADEPAEVESWAEQAEALAMLITALTGALEAEVSGAGEALVKAISMADRMLGEGEALDLLSDLEALPTTESDHRP